MPKRHDHIILNRLRAATALISAVSLFVTQSTAYALPAGGQVNAGTADIIYARARVNITQSSQDAVIDWSSFNIGSGEAVQFYQPSAASIALNRIHDANPSAIEGSLTANGQVWLVNPNGIMFGKGAEVNVGGLLATTSDIDNDRFMSGDYTFSHPGNPLASIFNAGHIQIADGGIAALVGPNVTNGGLIEARLGKVQLGSGDTFTFDLYGDGLINLAASPAITSQLIRNSGSIIADGGSVLLTAAAAGNVVNSLIDMSGIIQANSVGNQDGHVTLYAEGSNAVPGNIAADKGLLQGQSAVQVSGTINAIGRNAGEKGGIIEALADWVGIKSGATLNASGDSGGGTIRVGGDFHGQGATPTASTTIVEGSTNLYTNATNSGKGGNVAVWSDGNTSFSGNIEAKGGPNGGNGGFVETSGHELTAIGTVNAGAPKGNAGTWLLDPNDITISQSSCTGTSCSSANTIGTALSGGSNVTVTTSDGNITLNNNIVITDSGNSNVALTFQAGASISSSGGSSAITATGSGKLNAVFDADTVGGGGSISLMGNISTNGGDIWLGGGALDGNGHPTGTAVGTSTNGINISSATLNAGGGNISINGTGYTGGTNTGGADGVTINGTVETTGNGTVSITGQGGGSGNGTLNYGIGFLGNISTTDGNITLTGTGGNTTGYSNSGVVSGNGGTGNITASGNGSITITGNGNGSGYSEDGVWIGGVSSVFSVAGGNLSITGSGSIAGTGGSSYGVSIAPNMIETTGAGNISITGTGGGNASDTTGADIGISLGSTVKSTASGGGTITLTGNAGDNGGSGAANYGIFFLGAISSVDGNIGLTGTGSNSTGGSNWGVRIGGGNTGNVTASGNASITIQGTGQGSGGSDYGVYFSGVSSMLSVASGNLTISGNGSVTDTGGSDYGVYTYTGTVETTGTGNISITGTGGGNASDATGTDIGISLGSTVKSTASGGGIITLTGNAGDNGGSGATNCGIDAEAATLSSVDGNISLTGTGGNSTGGSNWGVAFGINSGSPITASGNASVTIQGTGKGSGGTDGGVFLSRAPTVLNVASGNLTITGSGSTADTGGSDYGVEMSIATVETTGTGNVSVTGTAGGSASDTTGSDYGLYLTGGSAVKSTISGGGTIALIGTGGDNGGSGATNYGIDDSGVSITSVSGNISLIGTGGAGSGGSNYGFYLSNNGAVGSGTSSANISITGIGGSGASNYGFATDSRVSDDIGGSTSSGNITLIQDSWNGSFSAKTSGNVTIAPYTSGNTVGFGTGGGNLSLTSTYLGYLNLSTAASLTIGNASTGAIDVNYSTSLPTNTAFTTNGANITLDSNMTTSGKSLTFNDPVVLGANRTLTTAGGAVNFNSAVDGAQTLTIANGAGNVLFGGAIGGSTPLASLSVSGSGTSTIDNNITTSGTIGFTGPVILGGNSVMTTTNSGVTFSSTVDGTSSGSQNLTVSDGTATTTFSGIVGGSTPLGNLTLTDDALSLAANVTVANNITIGPGTAGNTIGVDATSGYGLNLSTSLLGKLRWGGTLTIGASNAGNITANADSALLNVGNVTLLTGGNITTAGNWSKTSGSTDTLTLEAGTNITQNYAISGASGYALNVLMDSNMQGSGGYIDIENAVNTYGGNITMGGSEANPTNIVPGVGYALNTGTVIDSNGIGGIYVGGGNLNAGGGNILMNGQANSNSNGVFGIWTGGSITTGGSGTITLYGTASGSSGHQGIQVYNTSISTTGANPTGAITLVGNDTGGGYDIFATGYSSSSPVVITSSGSSPITLIGAGGGMIDGAGYGGNNNINIGGAGYSGNITLEANSISGFSSVNSPVQTTGNILIKPYTTGGTVGVDSSNGDTLDLTSTQLTAFNWGGTLTIGASNAGNITANADSALLNVGNVTLETGGNITTAGNWSKTSGSTDTLTLQAGQNITLGTNDTISGASGHALNVMLDSNYANGSSGYICLNSGANITTWGGNVTMGGGADPTTSSAWGNAGQASGVYINDSNITTGAGNLIINGNGYNNAAGSGNDGVDFHAPTWGNGLITTTSGSITINGTGGNGIANNYGVLVDGTGNNGAGSITTGSGTITITGTGGTGGTTSSYINNYGVNLGSISAKIRSTGTGAGLGTVSITGYGAAGYSGNNGIYVYSSSISTVDAPLSVKGTGGNGASSTNYGIDLYQDSTITSTGIGAVTVKGYGGNGTTNNYGINLYRSDIIGSGGGALDVEGTGGNGSGANNHGIYVYGDQYGDGPGGASGIYATGSGNVTVKGTGGNGVGSNVGVFLSYQTFAPLITVTTGALDIEGTGGTSGTIASDASNYGVYNQAGTISSTGTSSPGAFTIIGTGASGYSNNYGVYNTGTISTAGANLTITGTGGNGTSTGNYGTYIGGNVTSTGAGKITLISHGMDSAVDLFESSGFTIGGASDTGDISLQQDTLTLASSTSIKTSGNITIEPYTSGTTVGVGSGTGTLSLTDTYLGYLNWGNTLYIGGNTAATSTAGAMDINSAYNYANSVAFFTGTSNADITIDHSISKTSGTAAVMTLSAYRNIISNNWNYTIGSTSGTLDIILDADNNGNHSGYINAAENLTLSSNGGNIYVGGGALDGSGHPTAAAYGNSGQSAGVVFETMHAAGGNIVIQGIGYSGGDGVSNLGGTINTTGSGNITITGTGNGAGAGYDAQNTGTITVGDGTLTVNGTAGSGGTASGVLLSHGTLSASGTGNIAINGTGNNGYGFSMAYGTTNTVSTVGGAISITGTGSTEGIYTTNATNTIGGASTSGNITLQADKFSLGTGTTIKTSDNIQVEPYTTGGTVEVDASSGGTLNLTSTQLGYFNWGGTLTIGASNAGDITANADSALLNVGNVTLLTGGNITMGGNWSKSSGGTDTLTFEAGQSINGFSSFSIHGATGYALNVIFDSATAGGVGYIKNPEIATYGGDIYLGGGALDGSGHPTGFATGSAANSTQPGIFLNPGSLDAGGGNIVLRGQGGTYSGGSNYGIDLYGGNITNSGTGNITIIGIAGTGGSSNAGIGDHNSGSIIGAASGYSGNITLQADSFDLRAGVPIQTSGNITILPYTTGGTIGVDSTSGHTLDLTSTQLGYFNWGGTLTIGASNAGNITANADSALLNVGNVTLETGGSITTAGNWSKTAGSTDTLTLQAGQNITLGTNDTISGASGYALNVLMDSNYANGSSGYIYLNSGANITTWGGNITMGGGNGTISAGSGYAVGSSTTSNLFGIEVLSTVNAAGGNTLMNGEGGSFSASNRGVSIDGAVQTSGTGNISLYGLSSNSANNGSVIFINNTIQLGTGMLTINGNGSSNTATGYGVQVAGSGNLTAAGGTINITGIGGKNNAGPNYGIYENSGIIQNSGGSILLNGTGGSTTTGSNNYGIYLHGGTIQTGSTGTISLTGTGGSGTGGSNYGVYLDKNTSAQSVTSSGSGAINITGIGGIGGSNNYGIVTDNNSDIIGASSGYSGNIIMQADSLSLGTGTTIKTGGSIQVEPYTTGGTIEVDASSGGTLNLTAAQLAFFNWGGTLTIGASNAGDITANADSALLNTGNVTLLTGGNITVAGVWSEATNTSTDTLTLQAGKNITLNTNDGVSGASGHALNVLLDSNYANGSSGYIDINSFANITTYGGNITMGGGSAAISANNGFAVGSASIASGIYANSNIDAGGGNIIMNGQGGTTAGSNYGIEVYSGNGTIQTSGIGTINLTGIGGTGGTGNNVGVYLNGTAQTTGSGNLSIVGNGGSGSNWNYGVYMPGTAKTTSTGAVNITGTGGGGDLADGTYINGSVTSTAGGAIVINGFGGSSGGNNAGNNGINLHGATVQTGGTGTITLSGTGGTNTGSTNYGVNLEKGTSAASIASTGNGSISITGILGSGGTNYGIGTDANSDSIGGASYSGDITLQADKLNLGTGTSIQTSGNINVKEYTAGTTIGTGTGTGTLGLTDTYLGYFTFGSGKTFTIGDSSAGAIDIKSANTLLNTGNVTYISGAGITIDQAISKTAGSTDTLTLEAGTNITLNTSDTISGASGHALNVIMDANTGGTGGYISPGANITTYGGDIYMGGGALNGSGHPTGYSVGNSSSGTQYGINVNGNTFNAGGGNIILNGEGGTYASGTNYGVYIHNNPTIQTSGSGTISITGTAAASIDSTGSDAGIWIGTGNITTSGTGLISLTGTGGGAGGSTNYGIQMGGGGSIAPTGAAPVTITGTAGYGTVYGVASPAVTSAGGSVTVSSPTGISNGVITYAAGHSNDVVYDADTGGVSGTILMSSGSSISTNGGNIYFGGGSLDGSGHPIGAAMGTSINGYQDGISLGHLTIDAGGGNITMVGTGGTYSGGANYGLQLLGTTLQTSGNGNISLTGTGGNGSSSGSNYGVTLSQNVGMANVTSTGSGAINITGIGGIGGSNNYGIVTDNNSDIIGASAGYSGNITVQADSLSLGTGTTIKTSGNINILPNTTGGTIEVDAASGGTLNLTAAQLAFFNWGGALTIGASNAGNITANADSALLNTGNVTLLTGGNITVAGVWSEATNTSTDTLTLQAGKNITLNTNDSVSGASGHALNVLLDSDYANGGGYVYLNSGANITTWGGNITMGGGNGTISAGSGYAVGSSANNTQYGIYAADTVNAGGGNIVMNGHGGSYQPGSGSSSNFGIYLHNGSTVETSGNGTVTLYSQGGAGGAGTLGDYGIYDASTIISGNGAIAMYGTGGNAGSGNNNGIWLQNGTIAPTGNASITLNGTVGGGFSYGIYLNNTSNLIQSHGGGSVLLTSPSSIILGGTTIDSSNATPFSLVLDSASSGSTFYSGISLTGSTLDSSGGVIALGGGSLSGGLPTGAAYGQVTWGSNRYGISISNSTLNAEGGNLILTAIGGNSTGSSNGSEYGIYVSGSTLETSGGGGITLKGTGGIGTTGSNDGIYIAENGSNLSSITTGSNGTGAITLTGIIGTGGSNNYGIATDSNGEAIGNPTATSAIVLQDDSVSFGTGTTIQTAGNIQVEPYSAGTNISVGSNASTLGLSTTYLGYLNGGSYTFGNANDTGTLTAAAASWAAPVSFITKNTGLIDVTGTQTGTGSATVSFTGPTKLDYAGTDVTTNNSAITFNSAVTVGANATLSSGSATTAFGSTVDGGNNLTANAGTFSFGGTWGGSAPLAAVSLTSTNSLSLPAISAASIFAQTTGVTADLTLTGQLIASATGTPVTLVAGENFINSDGVSALNLTGGGSPRWLIYSTNPANNTLGGLTESFHRYSCIYGGSCPSFPGSGNGLLYTLSPTITVTANNDSGTYGNIAAFSASYSGFINGDTVGTALSGTPSLTSNATTSTSSNYNAGTWTITSAAGTLASAMGYQLSYAGGTLTVNTKALTITGLSGTNKVYDTTTGDTVSGTGTLTGIVSGVNNGGGTSDVVTLSNGSAGFADANVGNGKAVTFSGYSIMGADAGNYTLSQPAASSANITPAGLTVTADSKAKTYGTSDPSFTYSVSGLQGSDSAGGVLSGSLTRDPGENVGTYNITEGTLASNSNYTLTYVPGPFTITTANILAVAADNKTLVYGSSLPALTYTYSGLVNGDTSSVFTGALATAATSSSNVGTYSITQGTLSAGVNYAINFSSGTLAVTPASLSVTANSGQHKTYGASDSSLTYTYSGLVNNDTGSILSGGLSRVSGENVGTYIIGQGTLSAGSNYSISYTSANFAINPASLTITAKNVSMVYADGTTLNGTTGFSESGLLGSDSISSVSLATSGSTHLSTSGNYNVGTYSITPSGAAGSGLSNYSITYDPASVGLSVSAKSLSISGLSGTSKVYDSTSGDAVSGTGTLTGIVSGLNNGGGTSDVVTLSNGSAGFADANVGNGKAVTFSGYSIMGADAGNYTLSQPAASSANITPAALTVTADSKATTYGGNILPLTATITGFVGGQTLGTSGVTGNASLSTSATTSSNAGNYIITAARGSLNANNYDFILFNNGTLTINAAGAPNPPSPPPMPNSTPILIPNSYLDHYITTGSDAAPISCTGGKNWSDISCGAITNLHFSWLRVFDSVTNSTEYGSNEYWNDISDLAPAAGANQMNY